MTEIKKPLVHIRDIPSPEYYPINTDSLGTYASMRCVVWWDRVDAFDGKVALAVKEHKDAPWVKVPTLEQTIDDERGNGDGVVTFVYRPHTGLFAALYVDPGSATKGTINVILQMGNE